MDGHDRIELERQEPARLRVRPDARTGPDEREADGKHGPGPTLTPATLLHLQRAAGNTGVAELVAEERAEGHPEWLQRQALEEGAEEAARRGSSGLLSMRGGETTRATTRGAASSGGLLAGETLHLDPSIAAQIAAISRRLSPESIGPALLGVPLSLSGPPAFLPPTKPALGPLEGPGAPPLARREAGPGTLRDALDAVGAYPSIERLICVIQAQAMERLRRDWRRLSAGGKATVITNMALIVLPTATAAMADKASRDFILGQLNDQTFNVPGVDGLSVTLKTHGKDLGVTAMFDLAPYIHW